ALPVLCAPFLRGRAELSFLYPLQLCEETADKKEACRFLSLQKGYSNGLLVALCSSSADAVLCGHPHLLSALGQHFHGFHSRLVRRGHSVLACGRRSQHDSWPGTAEGLGTQCSMLRRLAPLLLLILPLCALGGDTPAYHLSVTVTAYCTGRVTAAGTRPRAGIVALSRGVERRMWLALYDSVHVQGMGVYTFEDRMPFYWQRRVDVYMPSCADARQFGARTARLERPL